MNESKQVPSELIPVTNEMIDAALPWLANIQHMRGADKRSAVQEAIRAAVSIAQTQPASGDALIAALENAAVQHDSNKRAGLGVMSGQRLSEARDALRAALRHQPASAALPLQTDLLSIGGQMANVFFNWSQEANAVGGMLKPEDRELLKRLQTQWDVAARASRKSAEPATTQEASAVTVPRDPTDDMLVIGQEAWLRLRKERPAIEDCKEAEAVYRAMLAVAPLSGAGETLTDEEIIAVKRESLARSAHDFRPYGDSLVFAYSIIAKLDAKRAGGAT